MIVRTRYRDIPAEEIGHATYTPWDSIRGKEIAILVPAVVNPVWTKPRLCNIDGPVYELHGEHPLFGGRAYVCPCVAEIGD